MSLNYKLAALFHLPVLLQRSSFILSDEQAGRSVNKTAFKEKKN